MIVNTDFFKSDYWKNKKQRVVACSGGFDPIHKGHIAYISSASHIYNELDSLLVVIVNGDNFLVQKKGKPFMNENERALIVDNIKGVDITYIWNGHDKYVSEALRLIRPSCFAKGGDRVSDDDMPFSELDVCRQIHCKIIYGVGGYNKSNSSSELLTNWKVVEKYD